MHHQNHPLTYLPAQPQAEAIHLMNSNQAGKIILRTNEEIHSGDLSKIINKPCRVKNHNIFFQQIRLRAVRNNNEVVFTC